MDVWSIDIRTVRGEPYWYEVWIANADTDWDDDIPMGTIEQPQDSEAWWFHPVFGSPFGPYSSAHECEAELRAAYKEAEIRYT